MAERSRKHSPAHEARVRRASVDAALSANATGSIPMIGNTGAIPKAGNTGSIPRIGSTGGIPRIGNTGSIPIRARHGRSSSQQQAALARKRISRLRFEEAAPEKKRRSPRFKESPQEEAAPVPQTPPRIPVHIIIGAFLAGVSIAAAVAAVSIGAMVRGVRAADNALRVEVGEIGIARVLHAHDVVPDAGEVFIETIVPNVTETDLTQIEAGPDAPVEEVQDAFGISMRAPVGFADTPTLTYLENCIDAFEADGRRIGFVLRDLETGRYISWRADESFYGASTIKAPLVTMLYETQGATLTPKLRELAHDTIVYSDNDAYRRLVYVAGRRAFSEWMEPFAPATSAQLRSATIWPFVTPAETEPVWEEIWRFCSSGTEEGSELAGYLATTETTAWGSLLRSQGAVWSKAGWYPDGFGDASSTNDCAVVFSPDGVYVAVVFSDAGEDFASLVPVLDALNMAHAKMCGGTPLSLTTHDWVPQQA